MIDAGSNLKFIARSGAGLDLIDVENALKKDIAVLNAPEGNRGHELMHRTVGLIGFGNMGSATAKRLEAFGCRIIAYDKYKSGFGNNRVEEATLKTLKEASDIISFHVPLTEVTKYYFDDAFLDEVHHNFILINTSRGGVVRLKTVLRGLESGKINAAGLDVLEQEKFLKLTPEQKGILMQLFDFDQVIFTPHIAGWTMESYIKINKTLVKKIKALNLA